jgi:hypothetical protein
MLTFTPIIGGFPNFGNLKKHTPVDPSGAVAKTAKTVDLTNLLHATSEAFS